MAVYAPADSQLWRLPWRCRGRRRFAFSEAFPGTGRRTSGNPIDDALRCLPAGSSLFDPVFLNERGEVAEGARSNVFVGRDGTLLTPSLSSSGCLPGVLRAELLAACRTFSENHAKWDLRSEIRRNFQFYNSFERAFAQSTSENLRSGRA
ncbi:MAG: aminotransferase class IV, partial [Azonexus sp.]|nr:aminotransferase class IV [Azonexus sp.]